MIETGRSPAWGQDDHAPVRERGQEEGGGPPCNSTSKGDWALVPKKNNKLSIFLPLHVGPGDAPKGTSLGLGGGMHYFSRVVLGCQYAKESNAWIKEPILVRIGDSDVLPRGVGNLVVGRWSCHGR